METSAAARRTSQPHKVRSAGSVFKNPVGESAGRLIESVGLKGARIGDAQISEVHANFIVNVGNASACDVKALVKLAQERVEETRGIELEPEIRFIG
jgi:UDP-N-acetylmuramate dehydrogenase